MKVIFLVNLYNECTSNGPNACSMGDCNEKSSDKSHIGFGYLEYTAQNSEGFPFWQTLTQSD
jgi:hypothetical protein